LINAAILDWQQDPHTHVLGRVDGADAGGLLYWTDQLTSGRESYGSLVASILNSAHSYKGDMVWGWVPDLLENKIFVTNKFAIDWGLSFNSPNESITQGMTIATAVTPTSTLAALQIIGVLEIHLF